ncbi:MAG TPA: hypothetical protein VFQ67_07130 [Allosphingosinicella sp.]|nr:hypothetical protein [Allosphingosinicella sp.]
MSFWLLPSLEKRWKATSAFATVSRAGAIAAATTAKSFLQVALFVFGAAFVALTLLSLIAPALDSAALIALHDSLAALERGSKGLREAVGQVLFWLALIALFYLVFRVRRQGLRAMLDGERERQLRDLAARRDRDGLEALPPTEPMTALAERFGQLRSLADARPAAEGMTPEQVQEVIAAELDSLAHHYSILDLERRVDLTNLPVFEPAGTGWRARLSLALFSRGAQKSLNLISRNAARAATAIGCLMVIGVSAPALAGLGLEPTLSRLADVQVFRTDEAARNSLQAIAQAARPLPPPADADTQLYRTAAQQFVRALNASQEWRNAPARMLSERASAAPASKADLVEELAVRDGILKEYASSVDADRRVAPVSVAQSDLVAPDTRQRYENLRTSLAAGSRQTASDEAVDRVAKWLRVEAARSPTFRERLAAGVASFREPATAWDYASTLIGDNLSAAIKDGLPDPAKAGLFDKQAAATGRKSVQSAAERFVRVKLAAFLQGVSTSQSYGDALNAVRAGGGANPVFRRGEARDIRALFTTAEADRAVIARAAEVDPPALAQRSSEAERKIARQMVEQIRQSSTGAIDSTRMRQALEGSLGNFEDFFPSQARTLTQTALGEAIPAPPPDIPFASPSAPGGAGGPPARSPARMSRSFRGLRASFRVGGVLIGSEPQSADVDYRRLLWAREGNRLRLTLVAADGSAMDVGAYPAGMIQQALAYAADGRPTTVTMVASPLTDAMLRVHIHPALAGTPLGFTFVELDRFVDEATASWAPRMEWETRVRIQLGLYEAAARRRRDRDGSGGSDPAGGPQPQSDRLGQYIAAAFPAQWRIEDPRHSVFAQYPGSFDLDLVRALRACAPSAGRGEDRYWDCVLAADAGRFDFPVPPEPVTWSGVREAPYSLTAQGLIPAFRGDAAHQPLRFMLQVAFRDDGVERACAGAGCAFGDGAEPWEFPMIATELERMVQASVAKDAEKSRIFADARDFTVLQRLFRAALRGDLGAAFPRPTLIALMRDARRVEAVRSAPTPDWSWSRSQAQVRLAQIKCARRTGAGGDDLGFVENFMSLLLDPANGARFAPEGPPPRRFACPDGA